MSNSENFISHINEGYSFKSSEVISLGAGIFEGETFSEAPVNIPLKTLNRHGLIAGATGTGKTKTLQLLAESLSDKGVPVLLMDLKGDLSGLAKPSDGHPKIDERHEKLGIPFEPSGYPVEILTLSEQEGTRLRATVSEFGPILLSRILDVTDTQAGILSVVFKYCDDNNLALLDLKDLKKVLQYVTSDEGKAEVQEQYGSISKASTGAILRKIIEIEQQGGELFFGERSFEVQDLMRHDDKGRGMINILRLTDIQDRPKLFSTFMLSLLAEVYSTLPEQGDGDRPELVLFLDEAHLIFNQASKALLDQIENIVKLIRSKGVGLYFVTQTPTDVPDGILGQLGLKVQHALRAFTAKDRKAIKLTAENYPLSDFYNTSELITGLGIGEALITALNEKGIPTPLAHVMLRAPKSRMGVLNQKELDNLIERSEIYDKYQEVLDPESAYEILSKKIEQAEAEEAKEAAREEQEKLNKRSSRSTPSSSSSRSSQSSDTQKAVLKVLTSATFIRGALGILQKILR